MRWAGLDRVLYSCRIGLLGLCALMLPSAPVYAASCAQLAAQLADLEGNDSYDEAANRQRTELARANSQLVRLGCRSGENDFDCRSLQRTISQMQTNLTRLERQAGKSTSERARSRIRRAMEQADCNAHRRVRVEEPDDSDETEEEEETKTPLPRIFRPFATEPEERAKPLQDKQKQEMARAAVPPRAPSRGLLGFLFGGDEELPAEAENERIPAASRQRIERLNREPLRNQREQVETEDGDRSEYSDTGGFSSKGGYRTLCVRLCDGYYWPMSFSTKTRYFDKDADACRASCPNLEVDLFVHRNPGQISDDAVSREGMPYAQLPNAFTYRKKYSQSCTCQPARVPALTEAMRPPAKDDEPPPPPMGAGLRDGTQGVSLRGALSEPDRASSAEVTSSAPARAPAP